MKQQNGELGVLRAVWVPKKLDEQIEETRKKLGYNRSRFYIYALTRLLQELSVLTTTVHGVWLGETNEKGEVIAAKPLKGGVVDG